MCVCVCVCNGWLSYVLCRICYASVIPIDKLKNISCNLKHRTIEIKFQVQVPPTYTHVPTCAWGASARKGNAAISGRSSHYTISEEERKRGEGVNKRARNYATHMRNYYVYNKIKSSL